MHFEILVEDASGKIALNSIVKKILGSKNNPGKAYTWRIFAYKGIGRIPKNLKPSIDAQKRILLDRLPEILRGYGKSLPKKDNCVVVLVDLDRRDCKQFKGELLSILHSCRPAPLTKFRLAIEEMEAWFMGDRNALIKAFPKANQKVLSSYSQDSICGTWEMLANSIYPGGASALKKTGWPRPGIEKCSWAEKIAPLMDIDSNKSKSFQVFRDCLRQLAAGKFST